MQFIVVYVTYSSRKEALKMSDHLLKKRLIACSNIFPIESAYWWEGRIERAREFVSLLKCRRGNWTKLKKEVERLHKYETPCIMRLGASANAAYEKWIDAESSGPR